MSASGKRWMGLVARVPCVMCAHMGLGETASCVHHLKFATGLTNKSSDFLTIAVCPEHHTGFTGIHQLKDAGLYRMYKKDELDFLADTIEGVHNLLYNAGLIGRAT